MTDETAIGQTPDEGVNDLGAIHAELVVLNDTLRRIADVLDQIERTGIPVYTNEYYSVATREAR